MAKNTEKIWRNFQYKCAELHVDDVQELYPTGFIFGINYSSGIETIQEKLTLSNVSCNVRYISTNLWGQIV